MTSTVKVTAESVQEGKHLAVYAADPKSGSTVGGNAKKLAVGESTTLTVHSTQKVTVEELDGSAD